VEIEDDLIQSLKDFPGPALDGVVAERVRLRARAALAAGTRRRGWRTVGRAASPVFVTSAVAVYLVWAVQFLAGLLH
jgi:hypothetical protein